MKTASWLLALCLVWMSALGQVPAGYYNEANGLQGEALKAALHNIIDVHTKINYEAAKAALMQLDEDLQDASLIMLIYKGTSIPKTDFNSGGDGWNREHLWPKSHGDFGTSKGAGTDLHALRPVDVSVNSSRGNKDFDNGGTPHPEATGCYADADSWEPRDAVKGDIARAMFYMSIRYEGDHTGEPDLEIMDHVTGSSSNGVGYLGVLSAMMEWNTADPVDAAETERNEIIYSLYQHNRNPFVDHPEFVELIWGDGLLPEPASYSTGFSSQTITLQWKDATGDLLPSGYLVRMSATGFDDITEPQDGVAFPNDFFDKNVAYGKGKCVFGGLTSGQRYYFKIFGYTGADDNIQYKTGSGVLHVDAVAQ